MEWQTGLTAEEDICEIAALEAAVFTDAWSERAVRESWEQKHTMMISLKKDGCVAGYAILYTVLDEAEIARIAVDARYRRCGAGSMIFEKIRELCADRKIERLLLDVRQSNDAAIAFYKKQGFGVDGIRRGFYELPKEDAVLMSMEAGCQIMH